MSSSLERWALADGWSAVGVPPGSTDHTLTGLDGELIPARVPGTAGEALRDAGLWQRGAARRLDAEDWWFRCRFEGPPPDPDAETVIRLEGIATVADVWLNGEHILASTNMHTGHEVSADSLQPGENELVIGIRALEPLLQERRPRPRWRTRLVESQNLRWFRTALVGRLPAFAPEPAPVGPWRPVTLERRRLIVADDLLVRTAVDGSVGVVTVRATLRPLTLDPTEVTVRLEGPSGSHAALLELSRDAGRVTATGSLRVDDAALWWPHTHGDPALHDVTLIVEGGGSTAVVPAGRVGFRTLAAADDPGLSLTVNGIAVFCRGGSLIPDAVTLDRQAGDLRNLLEQTRDAGMNMIRLSGVGTYANDELLTLSDELGLLVWQDFPFANLDYPIDDDAFRGAVETESRGFLRPAGAHPSLSVLCGNSEIEQQVGMLGLDPELGRGPLFGELLPRLIGEQEVDAHYVPSTPSGGDLPFRPNAGVAHYFGVGAYRRPLEDARRAEVRFATECLAIANVPDDDAIEALAPGGAARRVHHPAWKAGVPRDVGTGWDFDDVRDHYLQTLYGLDPVDLRWADPDRYLAVSRVVSGEVMAATFGEWRRRRSTCAGALVWTLNDPIPGAGWGVFDADGRPKAAYWYLRRALAPTAVWLTDEGNNGIAVHVANDRAAPLAGRLDASFHRTDGTMVESGSMELELGPHATVELPVEGLLGHFADASYAYRFGPPPHEVVVATLSEGDRQVSQAFHFPLGPPASVHSTDDIGLTAVATPAVDGTYTLELASRRLAYAVALDSPGFAPDDDFLTVAPGGSRSVTLVPTGSDPATPELVRPLNGYTPVRIELLGEG